MSKNTEKNTPKMTQEEGEAILLQSTMTGMRFHPYHQRRTKTLRGGKQDGSIDLVRFTHFPNQKIRHSILEVSKHGSGIPGAEARRKKFSTGIR